MFTSKKNKDLDREIGRVIDAMSEMPPYSEEYAKTVDCLRVLYEARSKKDASLLEPEALLAAAANIIGVLLILNYEQLNTIASKAMVFIRGQR